MKRLVSFVVCTLMCVAFAMSIFAEKAETTTVPVGTITIQEVVEPLFTGTSKAMVYDRFGEDVTNSYVAEIKPYALTGQWDKVSDYTREGHFKIIEVVEEKIVPSDSRRLNITKSYKYHASEYFTSLNGMATVGIQYWISGLYTCDPVNGIIASAYDATLDCVNVFDTPEYTLTCSNITTSASVDTSRNVAIFSASADIIAHLSNPSWGLVGDYDMGTITQSVETDEV